MRPPTLTSYAIYSACCGIFLLCDLYSFEAFCRRDPAQFVCFQKPAAHKAIFRTFEDREMILSVTERKFVNVYPTKNQNQELELTQSYFSKYLLLLVFWGISPI